MSECYSTLGGFKRFFDENVFDHHLGRYFLGNYFFLCFFFFKSFTWFLCDQIICDGSKLYSDADCPYVCVFFCSANTVFYQRVCEKSE